MRLPDDLCDEFDRTCAAYYQEWFDEREERRLKRVLHWFMGGKESGEGKSRRECSHEHFERLPGGELKCRDCGVTGN